MSQRTVIRIQELPDGSKSFFSLENPNSYPGSDKVFELKSLAEQSPFSDMHLGDGSPNWVMQAGRLLFDELAMHPAVGASMAEALKELHGGCSPLYLRLDDVTVAEELPWESVCLKNNDFLALDDRWPVVRVRKAIEVDPRLLYDFEAPLRITAILSAAGADATTRAPALPQWTALYAPILKALAKPGAIPVALTILVGEESLRDHIRSLNQSWIHCAFITDKSELLQDIKDSHPHILHFFCHGTSEEIPHLQIGSFIDWEAEREGTLAITAMELRQLADPKQGIWLVTLNCCESATQARDGRGLASSLVAAGFPAALGMREKIDVGLSHTVCESFYPALLELIAKPLPDGPSCEIEWAQALCRVRAKLADSNQNGKPTQEAARSCKSWTIPALYSRSEPFGLKRIVPQATVPGLSPAKRRQIDYILELQKQRTKAAEDYKDLPREALDAILADFDAQLAKATEKLKRTE
jgi:hypothetical protein